MDNSIIKKSFKESLSILAKQDREGVIRDKRINLSPAENGFVLDVSMDLEFGEGDKREYRYISRRWIFTDLEEAMKILTTEMEAKTGDKVMMSQVMNPTKGAVTVFAKSNIKFIVSENDGHIHFASGEIVSENDKKYFVGETLPESIYWKVGEPSKASTETEFTKKVSATLATHSHKIKFEMKDDNQVGMNIAGQTDATEQHFHKVDIVDIWSVHTSNTPDK